MTSYSGMFKWLPLFVTAAFCLVLLAWAASDVNGPDIDFDLNTQSGDYYNLLVDGFLDGHLSMKVPLEATGQLPVLMDASLYRGKYYMYFGVVPALFAFAPYSLLTGHDMPQNLATLLFVIGGFLMYLWLFTLARRRYFPACSKSVEVCAVVLLAFGSGTPILVWDAGFYEVAIAGGYLCVAAMLLSLYQTIHSPKYTVPWLAAASLAAGLAVGCRPTYLLTLPILLVPPLQIFRTRHTPEGRARLFKLAAAAMIPAGLIGLALMAYNYGRFDNPFEFGFKYQLNALMSSGLPFTQFSFIPANLDWYYLTPPVLSPYFPYVLPINASLRPANYYGYELIHGQWLVLPLLGISLAGVIWAKIRSLEPPVDLKIAIACALLAFGAIFAALLTFGFRANRYVVDFQPALILALTLVSGFVSAAARSVNCWFEKIYILLFCGLALSLSLFNYLIGIQWMDHMANTRPAIFQSLAYYGNYPSHWLHQLGLLDYGPVRFSVAFPLQGKTGPEPLLATGTSGYTDVIYASRHPDNRVQFGISHSNHGIIQSDPVSVKPGTKQMIEVETGSLYPPRLHPYFRGWNEIEIARVKTTVRVWLDRVEVLNVMHRSFDAPPQSLRLGQNPIDHDVPFSGQVGELQRRHPSPPKSNFKNEFGLWRLQAILPMHDLGIGQPLLASGFRGHGNLLFIEALAENEVRFGLDEWGAGRLSHSPRLAVDGSRPHQIEIIIGPHIIRQKLPADWKISRADLVSLSAQMQVWLDGQLVWNVLIHANESSYDLVSIGANAQGFSTAASLFNGPLKKLTLSDDEQNKLLRRALSVKIPPGAN